MFLFGDMNRLHTQQTCDLDFLNAQMVPDILVKTLIAGPYPFDMHEIGEISDKM